MREGSVFSHVCPSFSHSVQGSHVTITHDASDITMQGTPNSSPPPDMASQTPLLLTSGGQDWRPVQTYSLEDIPSWLPSSGNWNNRYGQCKRTVSILLECFLVTTHKQSLGQGNDFTRVCHSVHGGSLYDVTSCLAARSHVPSRGGLWGSLSHGGLCAGRGSLSGRPTVR